MDLKGFIMGFAIFIVSFIVCISFTINLYKPSGYDLNLSNDEDTKILYNLSQQANNSFNESNTLTNGMYNNVPGQNGSSFPPNTGTTDTQGSLQLSALSAVSGIWGMTTLFGNMLVAIFGILGFEPTIGQAYMWFALLIILIPLAIILLNSVLRNPL